MDMSLKPPRHLAPTVGQAASGITFCAGSRTVDDRRVVSGLVLAIGSIGCIIDNTKSFADVGVTGKGTVVTFGDFHVYVAVAAKEYPEEVYSYLAPSVFDAGIGDSDISFGYRGSGDADCDDTELKVYAEVHVVEHAAAGGGITTTPFTKPARLLATSATWRPTSSY